MSPASAGIPVAAFDFYAELQANNTREWWGQHKAQWESQVRDPLSALLEALEPEFGSGHLFRPHRDTRFSKDKSPIKEHQGAVIEIEDAMGYYVQVAATGLMVGGGWYSAQGQQLQRYRDAVEGATGAELERIIKALKRRFTLDGNLMKTRPRGIDAEHPRLELLRYRQFTAMRAYDVEPWLASGKALTTVRADWRALRPLLDWLADHVGPADDPGSST